MSEKDTKKAEKDKEKAAKKAEKEDAKRKKVPTSPPAPPPQIFALLCGVRRAHYVRHPGLVGNPRPPSHPFHTCLRPRRNP